MELKKTALHDIHVKLGARMVEFAGFHMPIQYHSIREEHIRVRKTVGVFDVSHMGEIIISGPKALEMVQKITINDAAKLEIGQVQYSAMCYPDGGIVDDLLVYRFADHYMLVVNASNKDKDYQWILKNKIDDCQVIDQSDAFTQLAVQGKKAEETLQKLTDVNLAAIKFYWFVEGKLADVPMIISRTGYTGEPGFELYFANEYAEKVWNAVMEAGKEFDIEPIGLGARDSLRLEKKMCLYGNDIDETTNPIEAGLGWITKLDKGDFIGREALLKIKEEGPKRKLVAIVLEGQGFPRHGYKIFKDGNEIGHVTSGTVSPILNKGIAMGYVAKEFARVGTELEIEIRAKKVPAIIIKPPFV
ncbi:Aminomethyltransferase [Caldithrix abyssi DSM 13497]|uniref:Aminomethyltransferase n=1 Tax=Caldithrix abyssi DSM 13497 TaxID=880073 RepID=H1XXL1_CALAY|nr:glycine cleavage system aminomethyltransferase GcvT [Caldithrix abyssi]APF19224.1 gcvT aminomethyltransferase [Caldithrix abyssi DSM 13497]EHO43135.1 Aminomethyltransferase [Caldithrix abyssi DSM 13497]